MSITASLIVEDRAQKDGRRSVRERHTDHLGVQHFWEYLAESGANASTIMAARVVFIETYLREAEINANLSKAYVGQTTFTFQHSTGPQNAARFREEFKAATGFPLTALGYSLETYRNSAPLSDTQMKSLFSINDAQLATLKTKLDAMEARFLAAMADVGS